MTECPTIAITTALCLYISPWKYGIGAYNFKIILQSEGVLKRLSKPAECKMTRQRLGMHVATETHSSAGDWCMHSEVT